MSDRNPKLEIHDSNIEHSFNTNTTNNYNSESGCINKISVLITIVVGLIAILAFLGIKSIDDIPSNNSGTKSKAYQILGTWRGDIISGNPGLWIFNAEGDLFFSDGINSTKGVNYYVDSNSLVLKELGRSTVIKIESISDNNLTLIYETRVFNLQRESNNMIPPFSNN